MAASINNIAATFATVPVTSIKPNSNKSISSSGNPTSGPKPPPFSASTAHRHDHQTNHPFSVGDKLPNASLSYLARNDVVKSITLSSLCKGKRVALVVVTAPFSPSCTRFVNRVKSAREKNAEVIACFVVSDVLVMRSWGQILAVGQKVMMLCDGLLTKKQ